MGKKSMSILLIAISVLSLAISFMAMSRVDKAQKDSAHAEQTQRQTEVSLKQIEAKPVDETPNMNKQYQVLESFVGAVVSDIQSKSDQDGTSYKSYGNEASFEALKGVLDAEGDVKANVKLANILITSNPENNELSNCFGDLIVTQNGQLEIKYKVLVGLTNNKVTSLQLFSSQGANNEKTN
ncbi:hypothetical protein WOSG25_070400 [Weissella oryzae SG25]|uniref:Uncharacterized protein n=1 Tax=Weissella oryzae (strain DSM 25784 / JCM 18191 / LMG 30913 / SG25) TaxID=1329250 RepID=A0A069CUZ3_WEIOS|nr:hypothetical protein [Weissella oryzae]GAK31063.1 hypothetical protein WOSG25_070400 [Weissella oryzae SG25]